MSNTRKLVRDKGTRTPPPSMIAYAEAYECGHCDADISVLHYPGEPDEMWHLNVAHDDGCPVLAGRVSSAPAGLRAAKGMR
jgi:hypothetical protein